MFEKEEGNEVKRQKEMFKAKARPRAICPGPASKQANTLDSLLLDVLIVASAFC
ncbi:hypothetical protein [Shewanella spartinae]|uniref:hypothetical protein n=1 Tax=Shewanella spartinae TaxID=2864205 RepID=UPI001C657570|nr:hypothetical protein [Shewanella spartinae]QYJ92246.1 hypothetical protein K0I31_11365 [Shewanella spartinae]